jgi:hypothetical protein
MTDYQMARAEADFLEPPDAPPADENGEPLEPCEDCGCLSCKCSELEDRAMERARAARYGFID